MEEEIEKIRFPTGHIQASEVANQTISYPVSADIERDFSTTHLSVPDPVGNRT
jgi:hypothetical protein